MTRTQYPSSDRAPAVPHAVAKLARPWRTARRRQSQDMRMGDASPDAGVVAPDLVRAMVPAEILQDDEIVLLLTKPSLFFIFYTSFFFMAVTLVLGALRRKACRC